MKHILCRLFIGLALLVGANRLSAQGTAFTYQGKLGLDGATFSGAYDLQFTLFATNITGSPIAGPVTNSDVAVSNGLFTTIVDFGENAFTGVSNWLQVAVRTNGSGAFSTLAPRQLLAPVPYAITAGNLASVLRDNILNGGGETIGGGDNNKASNFNSTISGGANNIASGNASVVSGGSENDSVADHATISGGQNNSIQSGSDHATIGGGNGNEIFSSAFESFIGGGQGNSVIIGANWATIGGGLDNFVSLGAAYSFIGGGQNNTASGQYATVAGGYGNTASGPHATVGGGEGNTANAESATVSGGYYNTAGNMATVPGGNGNTASGQYSFAAGNYAKAVNTGAFVWADSQNASFTSTANDQFLIRAQGGVGINVPNPQQELSVGGGVNIDQINANTGNLYPGLTFGSGSGEGIGSQRTAGANQYDLAFYTDFYPRMTILQNGNVGIGTASPTALLQVGNATCNGSTWANGSDRNSKEEFSAIDTGAVLEKVSALPITQWKYKVEKSGATHVGPMAQDFHAAFGLNGSDDTHISTVDEDGVALAAIQGLNRKLEETQQAVAAKDGQIQILKQQNDFLAQRLRQLEAMVTQIAAQK
jgi:hypothetical protein